MTSDRKTIFSEIYERNLWGGRESRSGPGSDLRATAHLRKALSELLSFLPIDSILDVPCGDFHWMQHVDLDGHHYIGADIVPEIIRENQAVYGAPNRKFVELDVLRDPLPAADLTFCKELFLHLANEDIIEILKKFRASNSKYTMLSSFFSTPIAIRGRIGYVKIPGLNGDVPDKYRAGYKNGRAVDLMHPPFSLPPPVFLIPSANPGMHMCLWRTEDLPLFN